MLGLDTNVLVRFLVRDHEAQFERARRLIRREVGAGGKVLVSLMVLMETEWVLRTRYGLQKTHVMEAISGLLDATEFELEDEPADRGNVLHVEGQRCRFCRLPDQSSQPQTWVQGHGDVRSAYVSDSYVRSANARGRFKLSWQCSAPTRLKRSSSHAAVCKAR